MAKSYDYKLAVWLRLEVSCTAPELLVELQEYLEAEYQIIKLEIVEESESDARANASNLLQLVGSGQRIPEKLRVQGRVFAFASDAVLAWMPLEQIQRHLA